MKRRLFSTAFLALLICFGNNRELFAAQWELIEPFEYSSAVEAQSLWAPQADSAPVSVISHRTGNGVTALVLPCDFSRISERGYWDLQRRKP